MSDQGVVPGRAGRGGLTVVSSRWIRQPDDKPVAVGSRLLRAARVRSIAPPTRLDRPAAPPVLTAVPGGTLGAPDVTPLPDQASVVIGSHPSCDVVLPGLRARHAVLGRDLQGRSVLKALAGGCHVDGSPVVSQVVDEDSDIRVGGHRLTLRVAAHA